LGWRFRLDFRIGWIDNKLYNKQNSQDYWRRPIGNHLTPRGIASPNDACAIRNLFKHGFSDFYKISA
jgi:hypothetical protein